ncbi:MAG: T9SS type A sorting domain-containing protein [Bacteroidetes bacterium]|nr:T9SS type A sorting domain-containing protein [Bacteroidota bacterium]
MKKLLIVFSLCLFLVNVTEANKWETVSNGYWNSGGVWLGGMAPPYTSSDTFLIKHPVIINATLTLNMGAYLQIDSMGGICGHEKLSVNTNAKLITYGILELDTLSIPGGNVNCLYPGIVILTLYGIISNGGYLYANSSFSVGPWFNCHLPEYAFAANVPFINSLSELSIFPNPFSSETTLHTDNYLTNATLTLYNCFGQTVKQYNNITGHSFTLSRNNLPSGLYFIRLTQDNKIFATDILVISD